MSGTVSLQYTKGARSEGLLCQNPVHHQWWLKEKNQAELTRDAMSKQKLGAGWLEIPSYPGT